MGDRRENTPRVDLPWVPRGEPGMTAQPSSFSFSSGPRLFPHLVPAPCTYPESWCPAAEGWPHPRPS